MNGMHLWAEDADVHQQRQAEVPGSVSGPLGAAIRSWYCEVVRVAVMAVGDRRAPVEEVGGDRLELGGVVDGPDPVPYAVGWSWSRERGALIRRGDKRRGGAAAFVDQEDRLEVRLRGGRQREPIADRAGHGVLVGQHDAGVGPGQPDPADQAALHVAVRRSLRRRRARGSRSRVRVPSDCHSRSCRAAIS